MNRACKKFYHFLRNAFGKADDYKCEYHLTKNNNYKQMKLLLSFFTLMFLVSVVNAQLIGPKISSLSQEHDFGQIVEGSIVVHSFTITNDGDSELYLIKVSSTCGCTVAKPEKEKLQPGESTKVKVTFNSASREGRQKKYINIFTNDKNNPRYRLLILANIISKDEVGTKSEPTPRISVSKNRHDYGKVKEGSILTFDLGIKSIGDSELIITDVQTSCGCTAALLSSDKLKPGESGNIRIELDTKGMKGKKTRTIAIKSNDPINPRMVVTLFVEVEPK
ncbi:MAG: DUF1573 domain-containing protein [Melioribacteraceae bacterium]|nr:DUF1573 domain-containing protein [Melioribacteraceae bacterium]